MGEGEDERIGGTSGRDQRQFVVIAAGGHGRLGTTRGDYVVAFALPKGAKSVPAGANEVN